MWVKSQIESSISLQESVTQILATNVGSKREKHKKGKIHEKCVICETSGCEGRWQKQNQQWNCEVRTLTPSRGIQIKSYTCKCGTVELHKMIHEPRESTLGSVEDTTHWISHESRGYCMSNWPLLRCLQIYCIEDFNG